MNSKEHLHKPLYTCESTLDAEKYGEMIAHFPSFYINAIKNGTLLTLIFLIYLGLTNDSFGPALTTAVLYQVLMMIIYKVRIKSIGQKAFLKMQKRTPMDTHFTTNFYEDYFMRYSEHSIRKIEYSQITQYIETDTSFYFECNGMFIFQKDNCSQELMNFIRNKFPNSSLASNSRFTKNNTNTISTIMFLLFILTLACFFLAPMTFGYLSRDTRGFLFVKYAWGFWLWLPVPILSIILGFKYKKAGINCAKNIISGFIIFGYLLIFGCFCFFPIGEAEYSQLFQYEDILDINLPANGQMTSIFYDTYSDSAISNFEEINVYFDNEDIPMVEKEVAYNLHWIPANQLSSPLKIVIPDSVFLSENSYISIYNSTTDEYNTLPESSGNYQLYIMAFNTHNADLVISHFDYEYVK